MNPTYAPTKPELPSRELTHAIIAAALEVSTTLGSGFLEKVYERALAQELRSRQFHVQTQPNLTVHYKGRVVGEYSPDLLINHQLILELKCANRLTGTDIAQCLNYLKATGLRLALLLNFQNPELEIRRVIL